MTSTNAAPKRQLLFSTKSSASESSATLPAVIRANQVRDWQWQAMLALTSKLTLTHCRQRWHVGCNAQNIDPMTSTAEMGTHRVRLVSAPYARLNHQCQCTGIVTKACVRMCLTDLIIVTPVKARPTATLAQASVPAIPKTWPACPRPDEHEVWRAPKHSIVVINDNFRSLPPDFPASWYRC